jgi:hypothetical protein
MSIKVMSWVWDHGPDNGTDRMLLLALADHCDDAGHAYPSMARLAAKACITERGARQIMRRLEAAGWVKTATGGGRGGTSNYHILMSNPEPQTGNDKPGMINREPECQKPGTRMPKTRNGGSGEPSRTIKEPARGARKVEIFDSQKGGQDYQWCPGLSFGENQTRAALWQWAKTRARPPTVTGPIASHHMREMAKLLTPSELQWLKLQEPEKMEIAS